MLDLRAIKNVGLYNYKNYLSLRVLMRIIALIDSYKNQLIILLNSYINQFFTQTSTILHYILFIIIDKEQIYTIKNQLVL